MTTLIELVKCNIKEIVRDTIQLVCFIFLPVIYSLLFGYVFLKSDLMAANGAYPGIFPGILAISIMQLGMLGATRIATFKEKKVLRTLSVTLINKKMFFTADILVKVMIGYMQSIIVLLIGYFFFDFRITGNVLMMMLWIAVGVLAFSTLGYAIVAFSKTVSASNAIIQILQIAMMFLSGVFLPVSVLPDFIRIIVKAMPLIYLVEALNYAIEGIEPIMSITIDAIVLLGFIALCSFIGIKSKWD